MSGGAEPLEDRLYFPRENQKRRPTVFRRNFHVLPTYSSAPAGLQCFQSRFFRREARGVVLCGHDATTVAVGTLGARKDAFGEARRP